jgi:hypothetical protein
MGWIGLLVIRQGLYPCHSVGELGPDEPTDIGAGVFESAGKVKAKSG